MQWYCKGLGARHEEVRLLMNNIKPSYICLEEILCENVKYSLERQCEFYATVPLGQEARTGQQLQPTFTNAAYETLRLTTKHCLQECPQWWDSKKNILSRAI